MSRTRTPAAKNADGSTSIRVQRCCNGCGTEIGDATTAELEHAYSGLPLPDVTLECEHCTALTPIYNQLQHELNPPVRCGGCRDLTNTHIPGCPALATGIGNLQQIIAERMRRTR